MNVQRTCLNDAVKSTIWSKNACSHPSTSASASASVIWGLVRRTVVLVYAFSVRHSLPPYLPKRPTGEIPG